MRIAIDLSRAGLAGIQTAGMNPCVRLAKAMVGAGTEHTFFVVLSDEDPASVPALRSMMAGTLPAWGVRSWHWPARTASSGRGDQRHDHWASSAAALFKRGLLADLAVGLVLIPVAGTVAVTADAPADDQPNVGAPTTWTVPLAADDDIEALAMQQLRRCEAWSAAGPLPPKRQLGSRMKLAFVSPLPPERTGIADYSAQVLPALAQFYDVDVIIDQAQLVAPWVSAHCGVRDVQWLLDHAQRYDRVMYHFGNSSYHKHMFELLARVPGVVVLHDFFLGDIYNYLAVHGVVPDGLFHALYESHGYGALRTWATEKNVVPLVAQYPANLGVVQKALGVIVHSEHARQLAETWYSRALARRWQVVALPRAVPQNGNRQQARQQLALAPDDFVVCSFGLMGATKLNERLLEAWLLSPLSQDERCRLVFVGEADAGDYGAAIEAKILSSGLGARISITGWADADVFHSYLAGADLAVQLRANSRGETSAAVLDCMNHGLPTLVNAHGAFAELPAEAVWMLPEVFDNQALADAMMALWLTPEQRRALGERAREVVGSAHSPETCAKQYVAAIEQAYESAGDSEGGLVRALASLEGPAPSDSECRSLARAIVQTRSCTRAHRQLLVDVSATARQDLQTGIQRVVRALVKELINQPPEGFRVEPVYLTEQGGAWHYRYARAWTARAMGLSPELLPDEPVDRWAGDVVLVADFTSAYVVEAEKAGVFSALKRDGIGLYFCVYDLLPIQRPEFFPPDQFGFLDWIRSVVRVADGVVCISRSVADDLTAWVLSEDLNRTRPIRIDWFHLGADIENSVPSKGLPKNAGSVLARIKARPSFLMVGTIEPRKGHLQTIEAFTRLWQAGQDINLVVVGREGWRGVPDEARRSIPQTMACLRSHAELGKRLLWLEDASDEYLEQAYAASTCLIAASEGEGFGLPLIEAAQKRMPILARDIPIFREVAGGHAHFFDGLAPEDMADAVVAWLRLSESGQAPTSAEMPWLTWRQSTELLLTRIELN